MSNIITQAIRNSLFHSLPCFEKHKAAITDRMAQALAARERDRPSPAQPETIALLLVNMLHEQAGNIVETGQLGDVQIYRAEHRFHAIEGRHYACFADALASVLRDAAGSAVSTEAASAWRDSFLTMVERMDQHPTFLPFETIVADRRWNRAQRG